MQLVHTILIDPDCTEDISFAAGYREASQAGAGVAIFFDADSVIPDEAAIKDAARRGMAITILPGKLLAKVLLKDRQNT
jgi:hypothetical protein